MGQAPSMFPRQRGILAPNLVFAYRADMAGASRETYQRELEAAYASHWKVINPGSTSMVYAYATDEMHLVGTVSAASSTLGLQLPEASDEKVDGLNAPLDQMVELIAHPTILCLLDESGVVDRPEVQLRLIETLEAVKYPLYVLMWAVEEDGSARIPTDLLRVEQRLFELTESFGIIDDERRAEQLDLYLEYWFLRVFGAGSGDDD